MKNLLIIIGISTAIVAASCSKSDFVPSAPVSNVPFSVATPFQINDLRSGSPEALINSGTTQEIYLNVLTKDPSQLFSTVKYSFFNRPNDSLLATVILPVPVSSQTPTSAVAANTITRFNSDRNGIFSTELRYGFVVPTSFKGRSITMTAVLLSNLGRDSTVLRPTRSSILPFLFTVRP